MDPTVTAALIGAGSVALGGVAGRLAGRRDRAATVQLTQTQTDDLESQIAERVIRMQEEERHKLAARISELESEVAALRAQYRDRERELQHDLQQARGECETLRAEVTSLHAQLAAKEVELATAVTEAGSLRALALSHTPPTATV